VKLEKPKQFEVDFGKRKHIANVILTVKPNMEVIWADP
jgi:predicted fused transcriptional regulator/phosphomethylpyrimidine kinase